MVAFQSIAMDTAGVYALDDGQWIGTDGLGICLGVTMNVVGRGVFVGHASCSTPVPNRQPNVPFTLVRDFMAMLMHDVVGAYDGDVHRDIRLVSGGVDASTRAMRAGVELWCGLAPDQLVQDSFRRQTDVATLTAVLGSDTPEAVAGPSIFEVPRIDGASA